ncbi:hypothetical protein LEMLEM_LOCUS26283 [Lemmus lemmus]
MSLGPFFPSRQEEAASKAALPAMCWTQHKLENLNHKTDLRVSLEKSPCGF